MRGGLPGTQKDERKEKPANTKTRREINSNTMRNKLLYSEFATCFGPSTQGAGIRYQNTSQIQILRHVKKKGEHGRT